MKKLSEEEKKRFRDDHIVYRASVIRAGLCALDGKINHLNISIRNACFVGCAVTVRAMIEFFGLTVDKKKFKLVARTKKDIRETDVLANMVGGELIEVEELASEDVETLKNGYLSAERSSAHFTHYKAINEFGGDTRSVYEAGKLLLKLLDEKVYIPNGEKLPDEWWPH